MRSGCLPLSIRHISSGIVRHLLTANTSCFVLSWIGQVKMPSLRLWRPSKDTFLKRRGTTLELDLASSWAYFTRTFVAARSRNSTPRPKNGKCILWGKSLQTRRYECFKGKGLGRTSLHSDWYTLLRFTWNMERQALWCKIRYLVFRLHFVLNVHGKTSLWSRGFLVAIQQNQSCPVLAHP